MRTGKLAESSLHQLSAAFLEKCLHSVSSLSFNVMSKSLGSERLGHYLAEAAGDIRDLLLPTLELPKAKL